MILQGILPEGITPILFSERQEGGYLIPGEYNPFFFRVPKMEGEPLVAAEYKVARSLRTLTTIALSALAFALVPSTLIGLAEASQILLSPYAIFFINLLTFFVVVSLLLVIRPGRG